MQRFSVSYVEVIQNNQAISSCYNQINDTGSYGSISQGSSSAAENAVTPHLFHELIMDLVLPNIVAVDGNKVTKVSMHLIDGFDCYYTTSGMKVRDLKIFVCFTKKSIPKILPIRILSELKLLHDEEGLLFNTTDSLSVRVGHITDNFHEELVAFRNSNTDPSVAKSADEDLTEILQVMNDNIDKFLQRQERVSLLVDKTSHLNDNSHAFNRKTVRLKRKMWWHRMKSVTLMIFTAILLLGILVIFFFDII